MFSTPPSSRLLAPSPITSSGKLRRLCWVSREGGDWALVTQRAVVTQSPAGGCSSGGSWGSVLGPVCSPDSPVTWTKAQSVPSVSGSIVGGVADIPEPCAAVQWHLDRLERSSIKASAESCPWRGINGKQ